ncbi:MAG: hypothetical protein AB8G05_17670 [Oligoflexales bacterium]
MFRFIISFFFFVSISNALIAQPKNNDDPSGKMLGPSKDLPIYIDRYGADEREKKVYLNEENYAEEEEYTNDEEYTEEEEYINDEEYTEEEFESTSVDDTQEIRKHLNSLAPKGANLNHWAYQDQCGDPDLYGLRNGRIARSQKRSKDKFYSNKRRALRSGNTNFDDIWKHSYRNWKRPSSS